MGISTASPQGSIAGGVNIKTNNVVFGGVIGKLDVRLAILAQHRTGVLPFNNGFSYDLPKQIISAQDAAEKFGFGSPIHLSALVLYNSKQSIGVLPVDVFPIKSADDGKSKGTLTLDDNLTTGDTFTVDAKVYTVETPLTNVDGRIKLGATLAETQANIIAAFDLSGVAGSQYAALMAPHPTVDIAAFSGDAAILTAKTSGVAGDAIVTIETFTPATPQFDAATLGTTQAGANVTAAGSIAFSGTQLTTQEYTLKIGSQIIRFTLVKGETALQAATKVKALLGSNVKLAITAGDIAADAIPLTANWGGITGNEIGIEVEGLVQGMTILPSAMVGGVGIPLIVNALANFQKFYTDVVNQFDDSGSLDALEVRNEELWAPEFSTPFLAYYGDTERDPTLVSADTETRLNERTNNKFPVPGSPSTHIEIASSLVALVATTKSQDQAQPYYGGIVYGITPGNEQVVQWDYNERDFIEKRGCGTSLFDNGFIKVADALTTSHPIGEDFPGYRYTVNVGKVQRQLSDIRKKYEGPDWAQKTLLGDRDEATSVNSRRPSDAKGDAWGLIDQWGLDAIIKDVEFAKENTSAEIDDTNPDRLNVVISTILSGSARNRSIDLNFSTEVGGN